MCLFQHYAKIEQKSSPSQMAINNNKEIKNIKIFAQMHLITSGEIFDKHDNK